ncbi:hypothetical protein BGZ79_004917, partial [Entomortierella chlamydospora]
RGLTKSEVQTQAETCSTVVKQKEAQVKKLRKAVSNKQALQTSASQSHRKAQDKASKSDAYAKLRAARETLRDGRKALSLKKRLSETSAKSNKISSSAEKAAVSDEDYAVQVETRVTVPTWIHPASEDKAEFFDISELVANARGKNRLITFAGTDYGLHRMSETVAMTQSQIESHINRYHALFGYEGEASSEYLSAPVGIGIDLPSISPSPLPESLSDLKLPKSNKITAAQVNSLSRSRKVSKKRERRLKKDEKVVEVFGVVSDKINSLTTADSMTAIDLAHDARKKVRDTLREFEASNPRQKELHTQRIRTKRTWSAMCANERRYVQQYAVQEHARNQKPIQSSSQAVELATGISRGSISDSRLMTQGLNLVDKQVILSDVSPIDGWCVRCQCHHIPTAVESKAFRHLGCCPRTVPEVLPILLIGDAGTCVGSRLGGQARRGGAKMREASK